MTEPHVLYRFHRNKVFLLIIHVEESTTFESSKEEDIESRALPYNVNRKLRQQIHVSREPTAKERTHASQANIEATDLQHHEMIETSNPVKTAI